MQLHNLPKTKNKRATKRRGKGVGSGQGKTAGRGHKGGKSRSGYSPSPVSSGIPYYRRLPKRGFSNFEFVKQYAIVNVCDLERLEGVDMINREVLIHAGLIRSSATQIKVLGHGEIKKSMTVQADKFSASAKEKIENAGGKIIVAGQE
jgi:large subunit ribosomal protein L15